MASGRRDQRSAMDGHRQRLGPLRVVLDSDGLAPPVQRPHVGQRVLPRHAREARLAAVDVLGDVVGLDGVQPPIGRHGYPLRLPVRAVDLDVTGAALAPAAEPRLRHDDMPLGAVDPHLAAHHQPHGARDLRDDVAVEQQRRRRVLVDAALRPDVPDRVHLAGLRNVDSEGRRGHQPAHRHRVAAHVQDAAAAESIGDVPLLQVEGETEAERRPHQLHVPDDSALDQLDKPLRLRVAAVHERLHQEHVAAPRRLHHGHGVGLVKGHRLLAQDVLARLGAPYSPLGVHRVGRRDVDGVDVRIVHQRLVAPMPALDPIRLAEALGVRLSPARHGNQVARVSVLQGLRESRGDLARAYDSPPKRHTHVSYLRTCSESSGCGLSLPPEGEG